MRKRSLVFAVCWLSVGVFSVPPANAQHNRISGERAFDRNTATNQYPGAANTYMAQKGSVVVDIFGLLDYGLTENVTVGTVLLPLVANIGSFDGGDLTGSLRIRYRFLSRSRWQSVINVVGLGLREYVQDNDEWNWAVGAASSTSYSWSRRNILTGTLSAGYFRANATIQPENARKQVSGTPIGIEFSYERLLGERFSLVGTVSGTPLLWAKNFENWTDVSVEIDKPTDSLTLSGTAQVRLGNWLLGVVGIAEPIKGDISPWLIAAWSS